MKLFQLYPKALAHLTCKSPSRAQTRPGEQRTENRTPLRGDGRSGGRVWKIYPAGLTRRTRRTTVQAQSANLPRPQ